MARQHKAAMDDYFTLTHTRRRDGRSFERCVFWTVLGLAMIVFIAA